MEVRRAFHILLVSMLTVTTGGCIFSVLEDELGKLSTISHLYSGDASSELLEFHSIVVVALRDRDAEEITSFRMLGGPGEYEIRSAKAPHYFFGFADMNRDLRFQADEPYGWAAGGDIVQRGGDATVDIDVTILPRPSEQHAFPRMLVDEPLENHLNNYARHNIGTVSSLDDPLFSNTQGKKGLWQPFAFVEDGGMGIHFLQPYDASKIPVLFVHGINGAPQNFSAVIEQLDKSRFQPWIVSYPSGLNLSWLSRGMFQFVEALHRQYRFDELHVVAHSMGGLVSRGSLNLCTQVHTCDYLRSYTTISTPWNGVASARSGVKWAPEVVPVWHDLDPESEFVTTLFETPLPNNVSHHLIFGFRQDSILASESSDGVISLASQLRPHAQEQARTLRGYDEGHVSILRSAAVISEINEILLGDAH
jgi:pimeloyl-ACP methyl ester carboxylesterase